MDAKEQVVAFDSLFTKATDALAHNDFENAGKLYHEMHAAYSVLLKSDVDNESKLLAHSCVSKVYEGLNVPKQGTKVWQGAKTLAAFSLVLLLIATVLTINPSIVGLAIYKESPLPQVINSVQNAPVSSSNSVSTQPITPTETITIFGQTTIELNQLFGIKGVGVYKASGSKKLGLSIQDHFLLVKPSAKGNFPVRLSRVANGKTELRSVLILSK